MSYRFELEPATLTSLFDRTRVRARARISYIMAPPAIQLKNNAKCKNGKN